jgi:uncharacterized FAD-dependent dehydrogenase
MVKRAVIVGAGPAGIGAAYTLAKNSKENLEIILIDQGKRVEDRQLVNPFDNSNGFGGVGAYSDGKHVFETALGRRQIGTNLGEIAMGLDREYLVKARTEIFQPFYERFAGTKMRSPSEDRLTRGKEIARLAGKNDMDYVLALDYHIGTDRLPEFMKLIQDDLESRGVKIVSETRTIDFDKNKVYVNKTSSLETEPEEIPYDYLIVCPGRDGSHWLSKTLKKRKIKHGTRPIDIGVRVETDAEIMKHLTEIERDVKFEFKHPNGDMIRTFCVCPYGQVTSEKKDPKVTEATYCLVNGESRSERISNNTNFALLVRMPLRNEASNGDYGRKIAELYEVAATTGRVVLQRYGDLKQGRSSKTEKILDWRIQPTLNSEKFMAGDIRVGMPARIMDDIRYGIERLSVPGLIEGLNQDSTLLYGPEIKFHGLNIHTDEYLQSVSIPHVYFAGDGTGISRGIGGAMASGIRAAEGILRDLK